MNILNEALDMIIDELRLPDPYLTELAWLAIRIHQTPSEPGRATEMEETKAPRREVDEFSDRALLIEHLRNGKTWREFADWQRSSDKHRIACGQLQIKAIVALADLTGLRIPDKVDVTTTPFLHAENTGDLLCRAVVKHLSGGQDIETVVKEIIVNGDRGAVLHGTTVLVEGIKEYKELTECRDSIVKALETLKESSEAMQVLDTYHQMEKALPKARNELRAVRLLGVLPGQCRLCRQFGL
jgi:hypothetical protein